MIDAGVGAKVSLKLGGKMDMPAIKTKGEPLEVTGVVRAITDGEYTITGPQFQGMRCYMGRTAVLDTGDGRDRGHRAQSGAVGPRRLHQRGHRSDTQALFLLLKSRMYFRPVFLPIAKGMVFCDSLGVGSSDWTLFDYKQAAPADLSAGLGISSRASLERGQC